MTKTAFTDLLQNTQTLSHERVADIKTLINAYPYMQSARALYLKGLKDQRSLAYNQELKITAAYTTDRSILFDYITSEEFAQNKISQFIKQNTKEVNDIEVDAETVSPRKSKIIDEALKTQIEETAGVLDPKLFEPKEKQPKITFALDTTKAIEEVTETTKTQEASAVDILNLGTPLNFAHKEKHSFNEWLKLTNIKPINRTKTTKEVSQNNEAPTTAKKAKKFELIDKFILEKPKIDPLKSSKTKGNLAKAQMIPTETLMTETLARIYVEQKNYKKAIQSYKILSLKYPEKSSFFANQIKAVEQLQEQNNKA